MSVSDRLSDLAFLADFFGLLHEVLLAVVIILLVAVLRRLR